VDQEGDSVSSYTKDPMVAISVQSYLVQVWSYSLDCRSAALWGIWGGHVLIWIRTTDSGLPGLYCGLYSWTACIFNIVERRESGPEPPRNASSVVLARAGTGTRRASAIGESDPGMRCERSASSEESRLCYTLLL
jgi:hypothetical protein